MYDDYDKLLEAILSLRNSDQFTVFTNWLRSLDEITNRQWLDIKDEALLRQTQGKQQALRSIIATIDQSYELLEARKEASKAGGNPNI